MSAPAVCATSSLLFTLSPEYFPPLCLCLPSLYPMHFSYSLLKSPSSNESHNNSKKHSAIVSAQSSAEARQFILFLLLCTTFFSLRSYTLVDLFDVKDFLFFRNTTLLLKKSCRYPRKLTFLPRLQQLLKCDWSLI